MLLLDQHGQVVQYCPRTFERCLWEMALAVQRIIDSDVSLIDTNDHQGVCACYAIDRERINKHNGIEPSTDLLCEFVCRQGMLSGVCKTQLASGIHGVEGFRTKRGTITERTQCGFR